MKKSFIILSMLTFLFCAVSCESVEEIPQDITAGELLQKGQDAYSSSDYVNAERYYLEVIKRFGNNLETYVEARYELGHLYLKTNDYEKAYASFKEILQIFDTAPANSLPRAYKKLAENGIAKIPQEELEKITSKK